MYPKDLTPGFGRREFFASLAAMGVAAVVKPEGRRLAPPETGLVQVACAISNGTTEIDWVGPQAVFETWHRDAAGKPAPKFKIFTVSETLDAVDGRVADFTFETAPAAHVVVVPAQRGSDALLAWLRKRAGACDVMMSVCIGARHLARAGLLDGQSATSHHGAIDQLAKEFPNVKWVRGVRFVEGDRIDGRRPDGGNRPRAARRRALLRARFGPHGRRAPRVRREEVDGWLMFLRGLRNRSGDRVIR